MSRHHWRTYTTEVDVDVDVEELLEEFSDEELADLGLVRLSPQGGSPRTACEYEPQPSITEHIWACRNVRREEVRT